jgi:hypothetical protein
MIVLAVGVDVPPGRRADRGSCDAELLVLALGTCPLLSGSG